MNTAAAAIAAHRFGLGEPTLNAIQSDPQGWLLAQIGPADAAIGDGLLSTPQALAHVRAEAENRRLAKNPPPGMAGEQALDNGLGKRVANGVVNGVANGVVNHYREVTLADARSRLITAATTQRPFTERLQLFWANHFTVSLAKGAVRGLVGAFERDAIRPHIAGSFEAMLVAATLHPAMLRYLDNNQSAGAHSMLAKRVARRSEAMQDSPRTVGLNENLAREVLELHTLGAASGRSTQGGVQDGARGHYRQADVTAFAAVLTGWRMSQQPTDDARNFDPAWHEPGPKTLLGKSYPEGPDALRQVLHDLAEHPATARFIATKLARHFIADEPPPAVVDALAATYLRSHGQLAEVYRELVRNPEAWLPTAAKLKTPEEFVLSTARVLGLGFDKCQSDWPGAGGNLTGSINAMGQRTHSAPSPAGWPDRAEDWLGPEAVWQRMEWATRVADRLGRSVDARQLASASLGPLLGDSSRQQIERAADGPQALALLLMSPEFQRR